MAQEKRNGSGAAAAAASKQQRQWGDPWHLLEAAGRPALGLAAAAAAAQSLLPEAALAAAAAAMGRPARAGVGGGVAQSGGGAETGLGAGPSSGGPALPCRLTGTGTISYESSNNDTVQKRKESKSPKTNFKDLIPSLNQIFGFEFCALVFFFVPYDMLARDRRCSDAAAGQWLPEESLALG